MIRIVITIILVCCSACSLMLDEKERLGERLDSGLGEVPTESDPAADSDVDTDTDVDTATTDNTDSGTVTFEDSELFGTGTDDGNTGGVTESSQGRSLAKASTEKPVTSPAAIHRTGSGIETSAVEPASP